MIAHDEDVAAHMKREILSLDQVKDLVWIADELLHFFKGNHEKVAAWLGTPNPNFGGIIPFNMILVGRGHKVKQFMDNAKKGNLP